MTKKRDRKSRPARSAPPAPRKRESRVPVRKRLGILAFVVAALAVLPYANALKNEFVLDDIAIVVENPLIRDVGNVGRIFTTNYWGTGSSDPSIIDSGLYRPLTVFSYAVDYSA